MITRDPAAASDTSYDVLIVGGGIYGAFAAYEASRRGLTSLLLERDDFGGATSGNSMRIVHGGLRYLQSLDIVRFRESVEERRWFLRNLPHLVRPLQCIMPLYGNGLKRPGVMRMALGLNDLLSADRNSEVVRERHLPRGRLVSRGETIELFPSVLQEGLRGAAIWWDAAMASPQRVIMQILRWACENGATVQNYVNVTKFIVDRGRILGARGVDRLTGNEYDFRAMHAINCAGPWVRSIGQLADGDRAELFRPSLAFNILIDATLPCPGAVAVAPGGTGHPVYFLYPYGESVMAGTVHAPWHGSSAHPEVSDELLQAFLDDLNAAIPALSVSSQDVKQIFAGLLPTTREGASELTKRPMVIEHDSPSGLFSVSGIKYTTARRIAERTVAQIQPGAVRSDLERNHVHFDLELAAPRLEDDVDDSALARVVDRLVREEAATCVDDVVFRRTNWGDDPDCGNAAARRIADVSPELAESVGRRDGSASRLQTIERRATH